ncbi:hypothetical protein Dsin_014564 [Dipteronia sinensis]|uniref:Uncharacterized protein n=1 Tax=Dipteronia sinensis TaxID=43782 RepID=A0AAE0ANA4_9ROSI|nr:hypothetical protein Dsin_014564 [Dipteronia sinensis]
MSDAAWGLSFGKFLELSFSKLAAASRVAIMWREHQDTEDSEYPSEVQALREAELQKCIIYLKGGGGIGSTRKCVIYKYSYLTALRWTKLQCWMRPFSIRRHVNFKCRLLCR